MYQKSNTPYGLHAGHLLFDKDYFLVLYTVNNVKRITNQCNVNQITNSQSDMYTILQLLTRPV